MSETKSSNRWFNILVNLIAGGALLQIIRMNLAEKSAGTSAEDVGKSKSLFKKIIYYLFSYFTIAAYITALGIIAILIAKHKNFQDMSSEETSVSIDSGLRIKKVLNDFDDIDCDVDLGVVLCKIRYHFEPDKLATCETKCAILALESKYECCGLGGHNQTLSGTAVSENCQNYYQISQNQTDNGGRRKRRNSENTENVGHYGLSNKFHEWRMKYIISEAEKAQDEREKLRESRINDLHCVPGKDKFCSCDPYLNELGFTTIALLGGLSFGNILILILRNLFEACCGKKKNKKEEGKEE